MDSRNEVREFLATRRAKLTPQQAGMPLFGGRRRVPGLRREEVALLAGVSTDYYTRLEKGHVTGVSDEVLDAVARALDLDEAERARLLDLVRAARPSRQPRRRPRTRIWPSLQRVLDALTNAPAIVRNGRVDILASNPLGRALYSPVFDEPAHGGNIARFQFLDPAARYFRPNWELAADTTVAIIRTEAGRDPHNRDLTDLVGELATKSEQFRIRWAGHNVRLHYPGAKTFRHPVVGEMELAFEAVDLPTDDLWGLNLTIYTAEPATRPRSASSCSRAGLPAKAPPHQTRRPSVASHPRITEPALDTEARPTACPKPRASPARPVTDATPRRAHPDGGQPRVFR